MTIIRGRLPEPGVRAALILADADKYFREAYEQHLADIRAETATKERACRRGNRS